MCPVTDASATVAPIGVKFCMMVVVHIGPGQFLFPFGDGAGAPRDPQIRILCLNFGHLISNISKTVSRSITCGLELNISSTRAF